MYLELAVELLCYASPQCAAFIAGCGCFTSPQHAAFTAGFSAPMPEGCSKLMSLQIKEYCQQNITMTM